MYRVNGATDALSIGPSAGYTLFLVFVQILLLFTVYVSSDTHTHIHVMTYITVIFWIKLKLKMSIYVAPSASLSSLAPTLRPIEYQAVPNVVGEASWLR
jgi:hypothetical protein